ncbi:hypothetical protein [Streptomyces cavourensis]|uniref:hypothetical protein n=1 Tax=Streptomyces cavourensis TaxID=67258 RepID=UPI003F5D50D1
MSASGAVPGGSAGAAAGLAAYRPELRPRVLLSDPLLDGAATVHLIKDTGSGNSFKVGPKEHFLIARMDGERSLAEIGEEYAGEYGRRLGDAHWQQILAMLGTKGLLAGTPAQPAPVTPPEPRTLLRGTLPLVADADATTARLHRPSRAPSCAAPSPWSPTPTPPPPASTASSASCSRPGRWVRCWC